MKHIKTIAIATVLFAFSCGPGDDNNETNNDSNNANNANNDNNTTGVTDPLVELSTISLGEDIVVQTALNADGTLIAIATQNAFVERVRIYSTSDGSEVVAMAELGEPGSPLMGSNVENQLSDVNGLVWRDNGELTALLTGVNTYTWDATSGDVLRSTVDGDGLSPCNGPNRHKAFHPTQNLVFTSAAAVPADNTFCQVDLSTGGQTVQLLDGFGGSAIEWITYDTTGETIWVSFSTPTEENFFSNDVTATVEFDPDTLLPTGNTVSTLGEAVSVDAGFITERGTTAPQVVLQPGGEINVRDDQSITSIDGTTLIGKISGGDINIVRLPEARVVGTVPEDSAQARSISHDGNVAAFGYRSDGNRVSVYNISGASPTSAFVPDPVPPAGLLTGTITIDGTEETLTGNCEVISNDDLGAIQLRVVATTSGGWDFDAYSQNGLAFVAYKLERDGESFVNSNTLSANFEGIETPVSTSDGTTIAGSGALFIFDENEFFDLVADASHPTGYRAIEIVVDGSCAQ